MKINEYIVGSNAVIIFMHDGQEKYDPESFLSKLEATGNNDYKQINAILDKTAKYGVVWNDHKTRRLRYDAVPLCEFKARGGARIIWFFDITRRNYLVCTHGFLKKRDDTPQNEIDRGKQRMALYYKLRKNDGTPTKK